MRGIRLAFRTLFKSPFVTSVAILSLALGIGANAAIFSLFNEILLSPLPVKDADRLVNLSAPGPKPGSQSCNQAGDCDVPFSAPMYRDLEASQTAFAGLAAHRLFGANVAYEGQTVNGEGTLVSGSYFPLLGVEPALGRLFGPADDETLGGHYEAVLGYGFWDLNLGRSPDVLGRTVVVNGQSFTVVGVAPQGFSGTTLGAEPLVYAPLSMAEVLGPGFLRMDNRRAYWLYVFARLKPGASIEQSTAALNVQYASILSEVEAPLQSGMSDQTMERFLARRITAEDGRRGQSSLHGEAKTPLLLLFATAGIVLLIACANIANLLLARGANRGMEMAVRLSLGANRGQVLRQLLTESLVLAALGGIASLAVAHATLGGIGTLLPPEAVRTLTLGLSLPVLLFAALLSMGTGFLFGIFPALHSTRPELVSTIRANAGNITVTRRAALFRSSLVTAQIALSMALLITAALFLRSLTNINRVNLGLDAENVVTFAISPELNGYEPARAKILFQQVRDELSALPGVTGVTASLVPILAGSSWGNDVSVEGFERGPDTDANSRFNEVGPGYFETLGIPVLSGHEFTAADEAGGTKVAIVNEAFAKKFNLGRDAVGKRIGTGSDDVLDIEIVGLVRDAKYNQVKGEVPPVFFRPWRQDTTIGALNFYVRGAVPTEQIVRSIRPIMAGLDPNLPIENMKTLPQQVRESVAVDRMIGTLSSSFAALATLLAAIGLYGVLAYTVARRTREIGVRMALGADGGSVRRMVLRQVALMLAIGGVVGIGGALALGRLASSLLYEVGGADPTAIVLATLLLTVFALAAGFVPAYRASRVDPMRALRYE